MYILTMFLFLTLGWSTMLFAETSLEANSPQQSQLEERIGVVIQKEWRKTLNSYCAGGSEYYVLQSEDESEITLEYETPEKGSTLKDFVDEWVLVTGYTQFKIITPQERMPHDRMPIEQPIGQHPISQHPVTQSPFSEEERPVIAQTLTHPVECEFFLVKSIERIETSE